MFAREKLLHELPRLTNFAKRLSRNQTDAEDLVQSTVLHALEKEDKFKEGTNLYGWLSKMMYNLFVNGYRRRVKYESRYDPENYIANLSSPPAQDEQMELSRVDHAIRLLSPEHRDVLMRVVIRGEKYKDAAKALDIPVGTVRSRLSRARRELAMWLDTETDIDAAGHLSGSGAGHQTQINKASGPATLTGKFAERY